MRRILMAVVMAAGVLVAAPSAQAEPNPDTCEGYPEPRVFVEAQGWWVQEPGDNGDHFGHIHVGTCFPLFQTVRGTVGFDLKFQLHDNPGQLFRVSPFLCTDQTNNDCYNVPRVPSSPR